MQELPDSNPQAEWKVPDSDPHVGWKVPEPYRKAFGLPSPSRVAVAEDLLSRKVLDPVERLRDALRVVEEARETWESAQARANDCNAVTTPDAAERKRIREEAHEAYRDYTRLHTEALKYEADVRRRTLESPEDAEWTAEFERVREALIQQYDGLGVQYELLCSNAAATGVKLRRMESSGRDYDSHEYVELHKLHLSYLNQLQKYTETMKSESMTRQTQDVAMALVGIFERRIGNTYPELWSACVKEIRQVLEGGSDPFMGRKDALQPPAAA